MGFGCNSPLRRLSRFITIFTLLTLCIRPMPSPVAGKIACSSSPGFRQPERFPKPDIVKDDFSSAEWTVSVIFFIVVVLFIGYHYALAWYYLPGVRMVSGGVDSGDSDEGNLFNVYLISRGVILAFSWPTAHLLMLTEKGGVTTTYCSPTCCRFFYNLGAS